MKKQILKAFLVLAVVGSASTAMAAGVTIISSVTIGAGNTFSPSTKVGISLISIATSYTASSAHLNGTKQYATIGGSNLTVATGLDNPSKIYTSDIEVQASTNTVGVPKAQADPKALTGPTDSKGWQ